MRLHLIFKIWKRNWLIFQRHWFVNFFWLSVEPLMYLGAIGFGLGSYIQNIDGQSYIDFYYPGLLCHTGVLVAYFEATYGTINKLTQNKFFQITSLTPLRTNEVLMGELLWCSSKGLLAALGVLIIASLFGLTTWGHLAALPLVFILCVIFSLIGLIVTAKLKTHDSLIYSTSGLIIPLTLVSGIYFPVMEMILPLRLVAYLSPITHALELMRAIIAFHFEVFQIFQIFVLVFLVMALYQVYIKVFSKRI